MQKKMRSHYLRIMGAHLLRSQKMGAHFLEYTIISFYFSFHYFTQKKCNIFHLCHCNNALFLPKIMEYVIVLMVFLMIYIYIYISKSRYGLTNHCHRIIVGDTELFDAIPFLWRLRKTTPRMDVVCFIRMAPINASMFLLQQKHHYCKPCGMFAA